MPVKAPPHPAGQDELDALIEEARRRARRRRLGYLAAVALAALLAGGLYLGFHGNGGGGSGSTGEPSPRGGASVHQPGSHSRQPSAYARRCPGRGLDALPLTGAAEQAARAVAQERVGSSPLVTTTVRPAMRAGPRGSEVTQMCGPRVAGRTLVVFTWDHRFDHGPNKSASLAQHAFLVSRFADGYHRWYWEH